MNMRFRKKSFAIPDEEAEFIWQRQYTEEMLERRKEMYERAKMHENANQIKISNLAG